MLRTRIIPALLLHDESLVKTVNFRKFTYIGDPCNTVRIFNELEVDELIFLDISAAKRNLEPNKKILKDIANECFMPLGYGGGIRNLAQAEEILKIGFEKIVINSYAYENPEFITQLADKFGSQAVIVSIDVKKNYWGHSRVYIKGGTKKTNIHPLEWAKKVESLGAGEILLTSIDKEGSWSGFDIDLIRPITQSISIPLIAHGGGGNIEHITEVVKNGGAAAIALGSMVVFQKKGMGVLINFPDKKTLEKELELT